MTAYRRGLDNWLGEHRPCEKMMVYDRNGVCIGKIKAVRLESGELIVSPPLWALNERRERRVDAGHCRVHGGAVHTSYSREELALAV
jgi:hypothetical protein